MTYLFHYPATPLNRYIDDVYYLNGPALYPRMKVLPMPSLHLMINFGDAFAVHRSTDNDVAVSYTDSWAVGMWSTAYTIDWSSTVNLYGIHFKPAGAYPFLRVPLSEMHSQVVPLDVLWGHAAAEIRERLYAAPTPQAGFALLEQRLLARLCETEGLNVVQYAVKEIAQQYGAVAIRALSDEIGISQNHLGNQFKRIIGTTPKEMARLYRFVHALRSINPQRNVDWIRLAQECGYYDQSHFVKDFVAFTGHTPTDYLSLRLRLCTDNPDQTHNLGQLPN